VKKLLKMALGVVCAISLPVIVYLVLGLFSFIAGANLKTQNPSLRTEYMFSLGPGRVVVIHDQYNKIKRSWGSSPTQILIDDEVRTIHFDRPAILKTAVDSIEPQREYVKLMGYMGAYTPGTEFIVDRTGKVRGVATHADWNDRP
jgi:hypothetical protein